MKGETSFRRWIKLLLINGVVLLVLLIIAELILSQTNDQRSNDQVSVRHIRLREHTPSVVKSYTLDRGVIEKTPLTNEMVDIEWGVDDKGFITPSNVHENPDFTIAFLGGSTTVVGQVEAENRFPYKVGQLLTNDSIKVNTINAGRGGNNSFHTLNILMNKVLPEEPHIAVMMHNINDLSNLLKWGDYWSMTGDHSHLVLVKPQRLGKTLVKEVQMLFPYLHQSYRNVVKKFRKRSIPLTDYPQIEYQKVNPEAIKEQFKKNLKLFIVTCRIHEVTPVLMTQANRFKTDLAGIEHHIAFIESNLKVPFAQFKSLYSEMNEIIREVATEEEVLLIDLDNGIPSDEIHMNDPVHLTEQGSLLATEIIVGPLGDLLKRE